MPVSATIEHQAVGAAKRRAPAGSPDVSIQEPGQGKARQGGDLSSPANRQARRPVKGVVWSFCASVSLGPAREFY